MSIIVISSNSFADVGVINGLAETITISAVRINALRFTIWLRSFSLFNLALDLPIITALQIQIQGIGVQFCHFRLLPPIRSSVFSGI